MHYLVKQRRSLLTDPAPSCTAYWGSFYFGRWTVVGQPDLRSRGPHGKVAVVTDARTAWPRGLVWRFVLILDVALLSVIGLASPSSARPPTAHHVYFREVLCYVPAFTPPGRTASLNIHSCASSSLLTLNNLHAHPDVNSAAGFTSNSVPADAGLADVPSTSRSHDRPNATVLLPGIRQTGKARYLLGPSQMGTSQIAHANAVKDQTGSWVVNYTMTEQGARMWDRVANEDFHLILGIDLDGVVVSAPIVQPIQSQFSSFNGRGQIAGGFTKTQAFALARGLSSRS